MAFCSAPSQVFQHWQGCSLRHYEAEPFKRRFELIGVDYTHSQDSFVDSDTLAIARVDADLVDFRVCGIQDRACGTEILTAVAGLLIVTERILWTPENRRTQVQQHEQSNQKRR